jgi:hypothetical protein
VSATASGFSTVSCGCLPLGLLQRDAHHERHCLGNQLRVCLPGDHLERLVERHALIVTVRDAVGGSVSHWQCNTFRHRQQSADAVALWQQHAHGQRATDGFIQQHWQRHRIAVALW